MKFNLHHLKDTMDIEETFDYQQHIKKIDDIIQIAPTHISGTLKQDTDYIIGNFEIKTVLTMACAKTLKPVDVPLEFDTELVFGSGDDAEYPITHPLDLTEIIFGQILSEKPYNVYHDDAKDITFEEKRGPHPAFEALDKRLKK